MNPEWALWVYNTILDWVNIFNAFAWIVSNMLVAYVSVLVLVFAIYYPLVFDPRATTVGKTIFRFFISLVGVIGLIFIGLYIDPAHGRTWLDYPGDVLFWRPLVRLIVYGYLAFTTTSLVIVLIIRRHWPDKLRTALDVKVREHHHDS